jgi:transposase
MGIDLANQVFQVHGVDNQEKPVLRKQLRRAKMPDYFQNLIGM